VFTRPPTSFGQAIVRQQQQALPAAKKADTFGLHRSEKMLCCQTDCHDGLNFFSIMKDIGSDTLRAPIHISLKQRFEK
jgi:hypothetical protein